MNMQRRFNRKHAPKLFRADEGAAATIQGYSAVFYDGTPETEYRLWDDLVERIMPGAFDRALRDAHDVRALFNHEADNLLGRTTAGTCRLSVDTVGLRYEIDPPDTQVARDLMTSLKRGDIDGSSFSFVETNVQWRDEEGVLYREVLDVDLYDVGPVTFPAYEASSALLRAADPAEARRQAQQWRTAQQADHAAGRRYQAHALELQSRL
jgi:HK97 family phage prohead protease